MIYQKIFCGIKDIARSFVDLRSANENGNKYSNFPRIILALIVLWFAYYTSEKNYLVFHFLFEILLISTGIAIFFIVWNSYKFLDNHFFLIIGIAYFFISVLSIMHLMLYESGGIFQQSEYQKTLKDMSMGFWLFARYLEAMAFLIATFFIKKRINSGLVFWIFFIVTGLLITLTFRSISIFPAIGKDGITEYFIMSELIVCLLFALSIFLINKNRSRFSRRVYNYVIFSLLINILAELILLILRYNELSVLLYIGFFIKIISCHLLYKSIVVTGLDQPADVLFRNLKQSKLALQRNQTRLGELTIRLKESVKEKENIFASMEDGVVVIDVDSKILFYNRAFMTKMNLENKKIKGKSIFKVLDIYDTEKKLISPIERRKIIKKIIAGNFKGGYKRVISLYGKDIKPKYYILFGTPLIIKGRVAGITVIYHDITHEKELEDLKSSFISFAAHEMRTPLSTLSLATESLLKNANSTNCISCLPYLKDLTKEIDEMSQVLERFLNLSKIENGKFKINNRLIDISCIVDEIIEKYLSKILSKKIKLVRQYRYDYPKIEADPYVINLVLSNLLNNAIKFCDNGGCIKIEININKKEVIIGVFDNGMGILKEDQAIIFDRMVRGSNAINRKEGYGVGLYLAKSLVNSYGGRIWCQSPAKNVENTSIKNPGSEFYFTIPLKEL